MELRALSLQKCRRTLDIVLKSSAIYANDGSAGAVKSRLKNLHAGSVGGLGGTFALSNLAQKYNYQRFQPYETLNAGQTCKTSRSSQSLSKNGTKKPNSSGALTQSRRTRFNQTEAQRMVGTYNFNILRGPFIMLINIHANHVRVYLI
jgi:hypothetical protein